MIRPVTVFCGLFALSSGLYLYHAKHEVELIDKHIDQIATETAVLRAGSRRMLDEWIRLGEPEQLHKYSDQYLGLKTIMPSQFVRLTDLPNRLPAIHIEPPEETVAQQVPGADIVTGPLPALTTMDGTEDADGEDLPLPPIPPILTATAPPPKPVASKPAVPDAPAKAVVMQAVSPRPAAPPQMVGQQTGQIPDAPVKALVMQAASPHPGVTSQVTGQIPDAQVKAVVMQAVGARPAVPPQQQIGQPPALAANKPADMGVTRVSDTGAIHATDLGTAHVSDMGANDVRRDVRLMQSPPMAPRPPAGPIQAQAQIQPPPQPAGGGSLLGSRGTVPLPLPAPTPVSATWSGR
jgi:hypothetical protein